MRLQPWQNFILVGFTTQHTITVLRGTAHMWSLKSKGFIPSRVWTCSPSLMAMCVLYDEILYVLCSFHCGVTLFSIQRLQGNMNISPVSFPACQIPPFLSCPWRLIQTQEVPFSVCVRHSVGEVILLKPIHTDMRRSQQHSLQSKVPRGAGYKVEWWLKPFTREAEFHLTT